MVGQSDKKYFVKYFDNKIFAKPTQTQSVSLQKQLKTTCPTE